MNTIKYINISLEGFGALLSLMIILFLLLTDRKKSEQDKLFIRILICNAAVLICDAAAWAFKGRPDLFSIFTVRTANFLVYTFGYLLMAVFSDYLVSFLSVKSNHALKQSSRIIWGIALAAIASVIISQFNHMYYLIDDQNMYRRQSLFWLSQLFGIAGMILNGTVLFRYRKNLKAREYYLFAAYIFMPLIAITVQIFIYGIALLYIASNITVICIYIFIQAGKFSENELELERSRTALMLSQINPHFLYNTLTSIRSMCVSTPEKAEEAIGEFSDFLRGNMNSISSTRLISFDKELEHLMHYLSIEKMRFEDRLSIVTDIQARSFSLPSLTVQPIAENAVRHGVSKKIGGGTVTISTRETATHFEISVVDDGVGFDTAQLKTNIGISNVSARLALQCGGKLDVQSEKGVGTTTVIKIPKGVQADA